MSEDTTADSTAIAEYLLGLVLITTILIAARLLLGVLLGMPVHAITIFGLLLGWVAGFVMTELHPFLHPRTPAPWVQTWANYREAIHPETALWEGNTAIITILTLAGGTYPWFAYHALGLTGDVFAGLPGAVLYSIAWSGGLFGLACIGFLATGALTISRESARQWLVLLGLFLVYGGLYGVVMGMWQSVWQPLIAG